ncbi:MAG: hypothetical protein Q9161_008309 [Pseudevernia consocians]
MQEDFVTRRTKISSPQPGDGICPTDIQCEDTAIASYREWATLFSEANESADDLHVADDLLELVERTPELYAHPSKAFAIHDTPYPQLKFALEWEFSAIYLVHPNANNPFTPSPPFGEIAISDISLEARRHLLHDHKMMESTTYWIFEAEELHPAHEKSEMIERPILRLPPIDRASHDDSPRSNRFEDAVDSVSRDATLNLFIWYRCLEGGLWLEENQGKHAWIIYDPDEGDAPGDEESNPPSDDSRIRRWQESTSPNVA